MIVKYIKEQDIVVYHPAKFYVGENVIIRNPRTEMLRTFGWVDNMDQYIGKMYKVYDVSRDPSDDDEWWALLEDYNGRQIDFYFRLEWLKVVA